MQRKTVHIRSISTFIYSKKSPEKICFRNEWPYLMSERQNRVAWRAAFQPFRHEKRPFGQIRLILTFLFCTIKANKAFTLRKHIFVIGCNQTLLVGSDVENAFIEDVEQYQNELVGDQCLHTVLYQRNKLIDNLKYFLSRSDASVYLSYSYYDK